MLLANRGEQVTLWVITFHDCQATVSSLHSLGHYKDQVRRTCNSCACQIACATGFRRFDIKSCVSPGLNMSNQQLAYPLCRDIKLENILLVPKKPLPSVKLCDFGYSKNEFWDSRPKSLSGTPDYIAPEILLNEHYDGKKADIWSCGVTMYVMLTGNDIPAALWRNIFACIMRKDQGDLVALLFQSSHCDGRLWRHMHIWYMLTKPLPCLIL